MPRKARKNYNSNFFHVMVQGINREYVFNNDENKEKYKEIIIKNIENNIQNKLNILSYCIMSNHTHFLFYCENFEDLSQMMHQINLSFSRYYNKINNRVGYVFRDRFKVQEIMDINQLYNCLRYIHNNPVKAKMCVTMSDYKYSSFNEFLGRHELINNESIDLLFGRLDNYQDMFEMIHKTFKSDDFIEVNDMNIDEFYNNFCEDNMTSIDDIKNNSDMLEKFIKHAKKETTNTLADISDFLGVSLYKVGLLYRK